jgi:hypothetical protein
MAHAILATAMTFIGFAGFLIGRASVWTQIEEENKKADPRQRIDLR